MAESGPRKNGPGFTFDFKCITKSKCIIKKFLNNLHITLHSINVSLQPNLHMHLTTYIINLYPKNTALNKIIFASVLFGIAYYHMIKHQSECSNLFSIMMRTCSVFTFDLLRDSAHNSMHNAIALFQIGTRHLFIDSR